MGTFTVNSQTLNVQYEYKNNVIIVQGGYVKDEVTGALSSINGSCYNKNEQGEAGTYIGNFNGYMRDGEVRYSLSEMSRSDSNKVWDAIDEIEPYVLDTGNENE